MPRECAKWAAESKNQEDQGPISRWSKPMWASLRQKNCRKQVSART